MKKIPMSHMKFRLISIDTSFWWMQDRNPYTFLESRSKPFAYLCCSSWRDSASRSSGMQSQRLVSAEYVDLMLLWVHNHVADYWHHTLEKVNFLKYCEHIPIRMDPPLYANLRMISSIIVFHLFFHLGADEEANLVALTDEDIQLCTIRK